MRQVKRDQWESVAAPWRLHECQGSHHQPWHPAALSGAPKLISQATSQTIRTSMAAELTVSLAPMTRARSKDSISGLT